MRNFSEYEQKVIEKLIKSQILKSNMLDFISEVWGENRGIVIERESKTITCLFFKEDTNTLNEFFELLALIKYLEKNHLIFMHGNSSIVDQGNFISKNLTQETIDKKAKELCMLDIPTNIFDLIVSYSKEYFVVGTELKKVVENGFKTDEQIRHEKELGEAKKQTKISKASFIIAIIALIISVLSPLLFEVTINQKQFTEMKEEINRRESNELEIMVEDTDI